MRRPRRILSPPPSTGPATLVTFEIRDVSPEVLVVTNAWPRADDSVYGVFIKRQIDSLRELGIPLDVMFVHGYRSKRAYPAAAAALTRLSRARRPPYRLVHTHGGETALAALGYRRAPIVASFLGDDLLGTPDLQGRVPATSRARRELIRQSTRFLARTITKSSEMHLALPRSCRGRNDVVPNGVDRRVFAPMERDVARSRLGWDPEARVVLFGGDPAVPRKRFWLASEAVQNAAAALANVRLETLGGVDPALVPTMMSAADCLLLTSSVEGSPNVVKEALMCNLPIVATPAGDVTELVRGVSPSWICPPSAGAIGQALVQCLGAPRRSDGRAQSAHLASDAVAQRIRSIYELMLGGAAIAELPREVLSSRPADGDARVTGASRR